MNPIRAAGLLIIGLAAWGYGLASIVVGRINLGGKWHDAFIAFADQPALYSIGILLILGMGSGALAVAWRFFRADRD